MEMLANASVEVAGVPLPGDVSGTKPVLRTRALRKTFTSGSQVISPLDGIDLSLEPGEMVAIIGIVVCAALGLGIMVGRLLGVLDL